MLARHIVKQGLLLKNAGVLSRAAYHQDGHYKSSTMNDLPVPSGDWHELHAKLNARYNAYLIAGIVLFTGTIAFAKQSGLIFLNYSPPKLD